MSTGNDNAATKDDRKQKVTSHIINGRENSGRESDEEFTSPHSHTAGSRHSYKEAMNTPLSEGNDNGSGFTEMPASSTCIEGVSPMALHNEECMRRKLQFYFMNPIEKWQARRKFPYKFVVQVNTYIHSPLLITNIFVYLKNFHIKFIK